MENQIFERDYRIKTTDKDMVKTSQKTESDDIAEKVAILDNIQDSIFKAINNTLSKYRYIVQKDKDTYDNLLHRLDAYAMRLQGKITGVVDYNTWCAYIVVSLNRFEACTPDEYALLSDMTKTNNVIFEAAENGGINLYIAIDYFNKVDLTNESIIEDEMFIENYNIEKKQALSDPQIAGLLEERGRQRNMTAEELYDWLAKCYRSNPDSLLGLLLSYALDDEKQRY